MKKQVLLTIATAIFSTAAFAGQPVVASSTNYTASEPVYGTGWYVALQGGVNIAQDYGSQSESVGGSKLTLDFNDNTGWIAGLKGGYVFGTGLFRPAVELDGFYNGFKTDTTLAINGRQFASGDADINSGALLVNALVRVNLGRFQPYIGAGAGTYYASIGDVDFTVFKSHLTGEGGDQWGFAWQAIGGADVYLTEKVSVFAEYKFLSYENTDLGDDHIYQHIAAVGVRWHF